LERYSPHLEKLSSGAAFLLTLLCLNEMAAAPQKAGVIPTVNARPVLTDESSSQVRHDDGPPADVPPLPQGELATLGRKWLDVLRTEKGDPTTRRSPGFIDCANSHLMSKPRALPNLMTPW
jgi:hypothetical protein